MGIGDKISNATEEAVGKVKEETGDLFNKESLEAEGLAQQAEANAKQAAEKAQDAVEDASDAAKDAFGS